MNQHPRVSVIMSVYNGEKYLLEAVDSILNQSYTDFEFLIIDDASLDNSFSILSNYNDSRITLFRNKKNLRLTKSLNKLLDIAKGEYIVRMDADDISLPERIKKQVEFMDIHPQIGLCGTARKVYMDGKIKEYNIEDSLYMNDMLLEGNRIAHPTVIIRKNLLDKYALRYDPKFKSAQDYELWSRMAKFFPIANIPEALIIYRHHDEQIRITKAREQEMYTLIVQNNMLKALYIKKNYQQSKISLLKKIIRNYFKIIKYKLYA